ncbi:MAG TPA: FAD-dependent oxidoreductase [Nocardioides sp.]|uniref:FAD-dependent oxidoreductase n=1 Tax=uncultured Nocardioides sp. TaxID=198441 RepID=UPI000EE80DDC|nr:FAD-dependent oxidoreductase [uncultured Nocardioides sp.]HCB02867.1 ferredoxin--NADP(+) reductase [Nocardioides sp.]HRI94836.1 FAD-dependent oxidoreductase [Nocardioides sp.]HRK44907.1 FAD-dependent oxidoreductase [Nocardioides sp.]
MTFVITQSCCEDAACVPVCPVQCIRPRPGDPDFKGAEQLYIDPSSCIDCGACATACPVDAIYSSEDLPSSLASFKAINAEYFVAHPLTPSEPPSVARHFLPPSQSTLRVAVVGSGPAALYAATELSELRDVEVTIIERLPTPFGLIRAGVAPDHESTKRIADRLGRVLYRPNVQCLFDVEVGRDVSITEVMQHHHAVIVATGAAGARRPGVPGEGRIGSVSAREFVSWYNGHPDNASPAFSIDGRRAVVVGNGNVALDVARLLARPATAYASTSVSDAALASLTASSIEEVVVVGRRSQAFAAYSTAELSALAHLPDVDLLAEANEVAVADEDWASAAISGRGWALGLRYDIVAEAAARMRTQPRRIILRYGLTPVSVLGESKVTGVELIRPDGTAEVIETSLVVWAVGFTGQPLTGLPFDEDRGVVPNRAGRVIDMHSGRRVPGVYCTGWVKRGASGVIGTNRVDASETVASLLDDFRSGNLAAPPGDAESFEDLVRERRPSVLETDGWRRIDEAEVGAGRDQGRSRVKFVTWAELRATGHSG